MDCPNCSTTVNEKKGSPVSPYINVYTCPKCGWRRLRCGKTTCDGYMESEGSFGTVRYTCVKCGWTGMGPKI